MPAETLSTDVPLDADIPLTKVVVVMMENRSFDHYLGQLGAYTGRADIDVAPAGASNPGRLGAEAGASYPRRHAPRECSLDTEHSWAKSHLEWDEGKMDGFFAASAGDGLVDQHLVDRPMWFYDASDLPFYYALASTFAVADHYHASALGPTWPNRMYLFSATSFGHTDNSTPSFPASPFPAVDVSILDELEQRHTSWLLFSDGISGAQTVHGGSVSSRWGRRVKEPVATFLEQARAGTLPEVSFVDPSFASSGPDSTDEHPPADVQVGEAFVYSLVTALLTSPDWPHLALFITYDEHGGFYDHVAPPPACAPDALSPTDSESRASGWAFDRLGVRVPMMVISPYARPSYVGHHTYDHTSLTRFLEAKFKLPALSARDANAEPPFDLFDFSQPRFLVPPTFAPPVVDAADLAWCRRNL